MTRETIYGFIAAEKTTYPVRLLCRVVRVGKSGFYDWLDRGRPVVSEDDLADAYAANQLWDAWAEHRRVYGARRLIAEIRDRGQDWNRKRAARLMPLAGIEGVHRRRQGKKRTRLRPARLLRTWSGASSWLRHPTGCGWPTDVPVRTSLGTMAIAFYALLVLCGSNDLIAYFFDISLNATTWAGRIGVLVVPPIVYYVTGRDGRFITDSIR